MYTVKPRYTPVLLCKNNGRAVICAISNYKKFSANNTSYGIFVYCYAFEKEIVCKKDKGQ